MDNLLTLIILIFSVVIHEIAHGYAANSLGDPTARLAGRLSLNPVRHIDLMGSIIVPVLLMISGSPIRFGWAKPVPYNPYNLKNRRWSEALVAVAGSATNIFLAILFGLFARIGSEWFPAPAISVAVSIAFINLLLGIFNLIPFPPFDGFTILRAILPWNSSLAISRFENRVRGMGIISLILFLFVFSFVLAGPFFKFVLWLFGLITGV